MDQEVMTAIYSGLIVIEQQIHEVLREINEMPETGWLLRAEIKDVDVEAANQLVESSGKILNEIRQLQAAYKMPKKTQSSRWHILNSLNEVATVLIGLTPERLQEYGRMSVDENQKLARHVDRMLSLANDMQRSLS